MTSPSAAGGAVRPDLRPDPETVTSVSELGHQLRLLRLAAGAPTLGRMEASAAEGGTSLPRSTISNAMSGRHLPALSTVLAFVSVCGCPAREISRWRAAWQRAYADRYMHPSDPVRSAPHVTAAPPGDRGAEAADEVDAEATDGVLAARIASLPLVQSAERLTALGPHRAAAILTALGAGPASARMALMPHEQTRTILVVMTPDVAAECMARWDEERVLSLMSDMAEDAAAARMTELPQATAAGLLIRMTASKRNTILTFLAPHLVSRLLAELSDDDALELLRTMDVRMAARVWSDRLLRLLLACTDTAWAVDVLNAKDPGSLFPMLERATDEERFATFRMVGPEQRGELIRFIEPDEPRYWGWMNAIGKDSVTEAIEALEPAHAADVLALTRRTWGPSFPDPRQQSQAEAEPHGHVSGPHITPVRRTAPR
ncbi:helix-turn-helix domain-containing protein [Streptomyces sp. NPDC046832]|uniref:magnesium transporter MgtE N-terminal domain-containing protein n=1 Tax=Streptomyces sp. NPDC046832 TaxID=3155020 RepID=UPI0033DF29A9